MNRSDEIPPLIEPGTYFRKDIQGLRAIGVMLVVAFHLWVGRPSGGVDVFFVVSAFLVTQNLLRSSAKGALTSTLSFWGKTVSKLVPTVAVVVFICLLIDYLHSNVIFVLDGPREAIASLLQIENLALMSSGTDYNNAERIPSLFQHFWALSLQMQFYFLLPFCVLGVSALSRSIFNGMHRASVAFIFCAILIVTSFAYALHVTRLTPASAYFNPGARLWEFMVGVICVGIAPRVQMSDKSRMILSWLGFGAILLTGIIVPRTWEYPGLAALLPVIGAALIIVSGNKPVCNDLRNVLDRPFFLRLADLSFGVYVWHWPILIFIVKATDDRFVNAPVGISIFFISIFLSLATKRLLETPVKSLLMETVQSGRSKSRKLFAPFIFTIILALPAIALLVTYIHNFVSLSRYTRMVFGSEKISMLLSDIQSSFHTFDRRFAAMVKERPEPYQIQCNVGLGSSELKRCEFGSTAANVPTIVIVGGSHSVHWLPAFQEMSNKIPLKIVVMTKDGCRMNGEMRIDYRTMDMGRSEECERWVDKTMEAISQMKPDAVFTTATAPSPDGEGDVVPSGYVQAWETMARHAGNVILVRDTPWPQVSKSSIPECVVRNRDHLVLCSIYRKKSTPLKSHLDSIALTNKNINILDMTSYFCNVMLCPAIINNMLVYRDGEHFTVAFAQSLSWVLEKEIRENIPDLLRSR